MNEYTDKEILDFLQEKTEEARHTGKVVFHWSTQGRGWRLHETSMVGAVPNVRQAIITKMPVKTESVAQAAWRETCEEMEKQEKKESDKIVLHEWYCHSCDFVMYHDQKDIKHIPCPNCSPDFELYKRTIPFRIFTVKEEEDVVRKFLDQENTIVRILKEDETLRHEIGVLREDLKEADKKIRKITAEADRRLCESCIENHPVGTICPPHEVRSTRPREAHFREQSQKKETTIVELRSIIKGMEESLQKLNAEVGLNNNRWNVLEKLINEKK